MSAPALTVDLFGVAQQVLTARWLLTFGAIGATGSLAPFLLRKAWPAKADIQRKVCALAAVLLCISAWPLIPDTFYVEARSARAFASVECTAVDTRLECDDGRVETLEQPAGARRGTLYELASSHAFLHFEPND